MYTDHTYHRPHGSHTFFREVIRLLRFRRRHRWPTIFRSQTKPIFRSQTRDH